MNKQDIFECISRFEAGGLTYMKLEHEGTVLELSKGASPAASAGAVPPVVFQAGAPMSAQTNGAAAQPAVPETASGAERTKAAEDLCYITAPMVGTFYAAEAPGSEPFAAAGKVIRKGETLCLIEAMKMMNELTAPCDLKIVEVLKENEALAAYGDKLFSYEKA